MTKNIEELTREALDLFVKGKLDQAVALFKKIYEIDSDNYQSIYNLGVISFTKKEYIQSSKYFKKAFEQNASLQYLNSLIESYLLSGKINEAKKIFEINTSIIDKENKDQIENKIVKLQTFHDIKKEQDKLNKLYKQIKDNSESDLILSNNESLLKNINLFRSKIDKALIEYPDETYLLSAYAQTLTFIKEEIEINAVSYEEIISLYEKSLNIDINDVATIVNLGIVYKRNNQIQESIKILTQGKELFPNDHLIFYNCGNSYLVMDNIKEAEKDFLKSINLSPDFFSAYLNLAKLYKENDDLVNSEVCYKKMTEINPLNPAGFRGLAAIKLINMEYKGAYKYLTKAMELDPNNDDARQNLSIYYYRTGKTEEAVELSKKTAGVIVFKNNEKYEIVK